MAYTPIYEKPYENGWEDLPSENTPATADILDQYDDTFKYIEEYLEENPIIQTSTMPTASEDELGHIYQYMGETTLAFTQGYFYKCVSEEEEEPSYSWENIDVQSGGGGGTTVVANPTGTPTDDLETVQIGNVIYDIPGGGGGNANIWTGTQAEYEAQASQIADDTVVLIIDDEEHTQAFDVYSTDEQAIGTWIDGSTIYRRTITGLSIQLNGTTWVNYDPSIPIDKLINVHAYYISSNGFMTCAIAEYQYNPSVGIS